MQTAVFDAFDALTRPTATARDVMAQVRGASIEVLFDDSMAAGGGLTSGISPVILGAQGVLENPRAMSDQIRVLLLALVHEGVHDLDVAAGRCLLEAAATAGQRFFTELCA